jgi:hypothetical protein
MDLPPARYYIMAGDSSQGSYYPGFADIRKSKIVTVQSNEIVDGLNFSMLTPYGGKVTGSVKADMATLGPRTATLTGPPLQDLLEVPVKPDGSFDFGHVPPSDNLILSLYPPTSGISSVKVKVGNTDVSGEELIPLPTQEVTGRLVTKKGPIPYGMYLDFETAKNIAEATIHPDGTFTAQLHAATHQIDMAGLPVGYSVASVTVGGKDASAGIVVGNKPVSDIVVTLNVPQQFGSLSGKISGLDPARYVSTTVVLTGPIVSTLQVSVHPDGTFDFPVLVPGLYSLTLSPGPAMTPMLISVESAIPYSVTVNVPSR